MRPENAKARVAAGSGGDKGQERYPDVIADPTLPQFRNRRAFVVWCVSFGFVDHSRLTEAVLSDLESEAAR
jgi:hypothetical protein